jgi:ammonia channel protein AmtB
MTGSRFIGDFAHIVSINVLDEPAFGTATIPVIAFYFFQLMFAATSTTSIFNLKINIYLYLYLY